MDSLILYHFCHAFQVPQTILKTAIINNTKGTGPWGEMQAKEMMVVANENAKWPYILSNKPGIRLALNAP